MDTQFEPLQTCERLSMKSCSKCQGHWRSRMPRQGLQMEPCSMDVDLRRLCKQEQLREAIDVLDLTVIKGLHVQSDTCMFLLETCIKLKALAQAHHVHSYIVKKGLKLSLFLNTRLIDMYAKIGCIDKAFEVFNQMSTRDVVVWNALIAGYARHEEPEAALELFSQMENDGVMPDEGTFVAVLIACGRLGDLEQAKHMHGHMIKLGVQQDLGISNTLIDMYAKCGSMVDAHGVFESMPLRSVVSWTAMIAGYAKHGHGTEALMLFSDMKRSAVNPDEVTFLIAINACATIGNLERGKHIHFFLMESSISKTLSVGNALIDMYTKCGSVEHAFQVFNELPNRDLISWTTMIAGYAKHSRLGEAVDLFDKMYQAGINPSEVTFLSILNACAQACALAEGKEMHSLMCKIGLNLSIVIECTLVDMYAKCGCIESARNIFDQMERRDSIAWNAMITGYSQCGHMVEAFELFQQMKLEGVELDEGTFVNILNTCASLAALDKGREIHVNIEKSRFKSNLFIGSALIDMYGKCGDVKGAREVFDRTLPNQCVVIWTAVITGYAQHGLYIEALGFIKKMHKEGVQLNDLSFLKILSACSYVGLVEEACFLFSYMNKMCGIKPHIEHYTCFVDLLGRAGRLEEAGYVITEMTCKATPEVWMALLGACRINGHVELAETVADCILKYMPYNSSTFLLLKSIYAAAEKWTDQETWECDCGVGVNRGSSTQGPS